MLVWNSAVPLSWGLLKYNHFGGQQLHQSQDFYPTFPCFSDLTSCWKGLAFASGSVETTSCPESSWMWLCAEVPFSKIRAVGLNSSHKVEEKVLVPSYHSGLARMDGVAVFWLSNSWTSAGAQTPLRCQKSLVLDTSKNWLLDLPLLLPRLCPFCSLADVGGFVLSALQKYFSAGHTLLPSWKANLLPFFHPEEKK